MRDVNDIPPSTAFLGVVSCVNCERLGFRAADVATNGGGGRGGREMLPQMVAAACVDDEEKILGN
jgi:hypothetical protein